jgi:uncharacterized protein (DUF736 family)
MNIGEFKNVNGQLLGSIATSKIDLPKLGLKPVSSTNSRAPAYEIVTLNAGKRWVQIGALWEATSNSSGEVFYQGSIDDPSFDAAMPIALFGVDDGGYRVAWSRPKPQRTGIDGTTKGKRAATAAPFGEGNADDNGQVTGEHELDEQVPF